MAPDRHLAISKHPETKLDSRVLVENSVLRSYVIVLWALNPLLSLRAHCSQATQRLLSKQDWLLQGEEQNVSHVMSPIFFYILRILPQALAEF